jgi:hypothetical protein
LPAPSHIFRNRLFFLYHPFIHSIISLSLSLHILPTSLSLNSFVHQQRTTCSFVSAHSNRCFACHRLSLCFCSPTAPLSAHPHLPASSHFKSLIHITTKKQFHRSLTRSIIIIYRSTMSPLVHLVSSRLRLPRRCGPHTINRKPFSVSHSGRGAGGGGRESWRTVTAVSEPASQPHPRNLLPNTLIRRHQDEQHSPSNRSLPFYSSSSPLPLLTYTLFAPSINLLITHASGRTHANSRSLVTFGYKMLETIPPFPF